MAYPPALGGDYAVVAIANESIFGPTQTGNREPLVVEFACDTEQCIYVATLGDGSTITGTVDPVDSPVVVGASGGANTRIVSMVARSLTGVGRCKARIVVQ